RRATRAPRQRRRILYRPLSCHQRTVSAIRGRDVACNVRRDPTPRRGLPGRIARDALRWLPRLLETAGAGVFFVPRGAGGTSYAKPTGAILKVRRARTIDSPSTLWCTWL